MQRTGSRLIFQGNGSLLQVAGLLLDGCTATVVIRANQAAVFVANCSRAIKFGATAAIPEAVCRKDGVVLLTGILYWIVCRHTVNGADLSSK